MSTETMASAGPDQKNASEENDRRDTGLVYIRGEVDKGHCGVCVQEWNAHSYRCTRAVGRTSQFSMGKPPSRSV